MRFLLASAFCLVSYTSLSAESPRQQALANLVAQSLESTLKVAARSVESLGSQYAKITSEQERRTSLESGVEHWQSVAIPGEKVSAFRTWRKGAKQPKQMAPHYALYSYGQSGDVSEATAVELASLQELAPVMAYAYNSLPFSWVYLTTAQENFLIYPFLTPSEAVANYLPSKQAFYQCAGFERRQPGWSSPYLDLVGQGMMVTVSAPIYSGDKLLGVASRDLTLDQLTEESLSALTRGNAMEAVITDASGLVIDVSDPKTQKQINEINAVAGEPVVFFGTPETLPKGGKASPLEWANKVVAMLKQSGWPTSDSIHSGNYKASVVSIPTTGWYLLVASEK